MSNEKQAAAFLEGLFDFSDVPLHVFIQEGVAADLCALIHHAGHDRKSVCKGTGISKKKLRKILSGDRDLTLKEICRISDFLGYTFDTIFYNRDYDKPLQPWFIDRLSSSKNDTSLKD